MITYVVWQAVYLQIRKSISIVKCSVHKQLQVTKKEGFNKGLTTFIRKISLNSWSFIML